jgi:hypothetical protein
MTPTPAHIPSSRYASGIAQAVATGTQETSARHGEQYAERVATQRHRPPHGAHAQQEPQVIRSGGHLDTASAKEAERIRRVSPEGLPAHPEARGGTLVLLTAAAMMVLLMISIALAAYGAFWLAATVTALGLLFGVLANPVVWASVLRARERDHADERDGDLLD